MNLSPAVSPSLAWHSLDLLWQGDQHDVRHGLPHSILPPPWQILILGDGSPTRHLQLLTGEKTEVDVIDMAPVGPRDDGAPPQIDTVPSPHLRRQVWLRTQSGQRLAYAVSWWDASHVDEYLQNRNLPIWDSLSRLHTELYRDIQAIYCGHNRALADAFDQEGPFWGRHYLFWHDRKPLTLIYEIFSPYLSRYLGELPRAKF